MSNDNIKINKKSWSTEEDALLMKLIDEFGASGSWTMISSRMGDRSGKQCRERFHNHLKSDINKSAFTKEEDALVNELQLKLGNQWAKISKHFNGRSDNAVKNRWHIINRNKTEAIVTTAPVLSRKPPLVPMLALNFKHVAMNSSINDLSNGMDMMNLYHSHCEHSHEPTLSSRSVVVPSSGRRSVDSDGTVAWRCNILMINDAISSSDSESDNDSWIDELLTTSYYSESSDEDWSSGDDCDRDYTVNTDVFEEMNTISPRLEAAIKVIYDAFSEAALTQRQNPEEFEYFEGDETFDMSEDICDLLQFEDEIISVKPSPVVKSSMTTMFKRFSECLPRLTPRSPAYPVDTIKRQRGVQPGGSPFIRM